ncbi:HD domain-containing protein [Allokutzneria sp. NRRL B-24872]|uniref:HD domain-containing protein n=1 Tax=Allokutzneria sp. NRRL B-24872 TaxID=1137961 RepID=UPI001AEF6E71|nr:HD domain-containing protein [Allokutzneria sp. NRRL B-24872]
MDQFPQTELAVEAVRFARRAEAPAIFNHSMRTYLYGRFLGERRGWRAGLDYDDELLFLGCVLHDIGLSEEGDGDQSFDIDGADLAARFLTDQGVSADRVEVVWDAIALHLCFEVAQRKRPEIALVTLGAGYDLGPNRDHPLPEGYAERVHAEFPRLHGAAALHKAIVDQALAKPQKAPPFTLPGELVRQTTGAQWPTWHDLMAREPSWNDHVGWPG